MRLYGKRFLKQSMDRSAQNRQETRDGILWDVLPAQRLCRVKIQGSNSLIIAHYPENWEKTPFWLKAGNAVRIMHTQGVRGRIEVVGHGQVIPTPMSGGGGTFPTPGTPVDCILIGCRITQIFNDPRMAVFVHIGTYRIGGAVYTLDAIAMSASAIYTLGDGGLMGDIAGVVNINAAPASGYFRYDLICVGTDGVLDYIAGTPATSNPVKPSVPASHVQVGDYILVDSGTTAITQAHIGSLWTGRTPMSLAMIITDSDLAWGEMSTDVEIKVYDQYGNLLPGTGYGWYLTLSIESGNGTVHSDEEGDSTSKIGAHTGTGSSYVFTYTRDGLDPGDVSPIIMGVLEMDKVLEVYKYIILRDAGGNIMR
jgi:hypothetical protein